MRVSAAVASAFGFAIVVVACSGASGGGSGANDGGGPDPLDGSSTTADGGLPDGCERREVVTCLGDFAKDVGAVLLAPDVVCTPGVTCTTGLCCGTPGYTQCAYDIPNSTSCFKEGDHECNLASKPGRRCGANEDCFEDGCCPKGKTCGRCDAAGNALDPCQCAPKVPATTVCAGPGSGPSVVQFCGTKDNCGTPVECTCPATWTCSAAGTCVKPCLSCNQALLAVQLNANHTSTLVEVCAGTATTLFDAVLACRCAAGPSTCSPYPCNATQCAGAPGTQAYSDTCAYCLTGGNIGDCAAERAACKSEGCCKSGQQAASCGGANCCNPGGVPSSDGGFICP
jgi:hypothetical protein